MWRLGIQVGSNGTRRERLERDEVRRVHHHAGAALHLCITSRKEQRRGSSKYSALRRISVHWRHDRVAMSCEWVCSIDAPACAHRS
jgi:hypothetical protein